MTEALLTHVLADFHPGMEVYFLSEYRILRGVVVSTGRKNVKVRVPPQAGLNEHEITRAPEKLFFAHDKVALVWETWKGVNGRGGYRLDPQGYPDEQRPVSQWPSATYVRECEPPNQVAPRRRMT